MPRAGSVCWCGNRALEVFSEEYLHCSQCETLVAASQPEAEDLFAGNGERGLYGRDYFESYQVERLGLPPISERARLDLSERCVHWLGTLLKYKLPPARVLEIGSLHGGFVALLRWAGFDATGLELSPWAVDFARRTFDIPVLQGYVEQQELAPQAFDVIVMMDVLEHLPDPEGTVQHCKKLLRPDGILLIQTPAYPEGKSLQEMKAHDDQFVRMLLPEQHLYLFSRRSVTELLARAGMAHAQFEQAIFARYDMFLVGSFSAPAVLPDEAVRTKLSANASARLVQALLDCGERISSLSSRLQFAEADRAARLRVIENQGNQLGELEAERNNLQAETAALRAHMEMLEQKRFDKLMAIESELRETIGQLESVRTELESSQRRFRSYALQVEAQQRLIERLRRTYPYRLLRRLGLWSWMDKS